jgi:hypothetical protein
MKSDVASAGIHNACTLQLEQAILASCISTSLLNTLILLILIPLIAYTTLYATLREESVACNYLYWEVKWLLNGYLN